MNNFIRTLTFTLGGVFFTQSLHAKDTPFAYDDIEFFQKSCQEVISIFENKNQPNQYAALHTSMAEAMRAGYCIGVVQQYIKQQTSCSSRRYSNSDWFKVANVIARLPLSEPEFKHISAIKLLENAYCGR